jgi:ubiquinone/menaquinone biosynthesis C-methylase UbiE
MSIVDKTEYDSIAPNYIQEVEKKLSWNNLYERPYMLSIFDDFTNKNILDVGCGTGYYSFYALEKGASVTSVDASQKMLDYIKLKNKSESIQLVKSDLAIGLPSIKDDSQDYIICSLVLHYIENWDIIFAEFHRVLKKGGKLYISTHHPFIDYLHLNKESYFDKYLIEDTWGSKGNEYKVHYFTRSLTDLLKPALTSKFIIINIEEPQPTEKCKELDVKTYNRLKTKPAFVFLTLEK